MRTLEDVLLAHEWTWKALTPSRIVLACSCGDELIPEYSSRVATLEHHRAHVADAVRAWLAEVATRDEVVKQVADATAGMLAWQPPQLPESLDAFAEIHATAALAAFVAAVTEVGK